jgi:phosphonate transport system substrate-binding protein
MNSTRLFYRVFTDTSKHASRMNRILVLFFLLCMAVTIGCSNTDTSLPEEAITQKETGSKEKNLLIGLIPERNIFKQIERYNPLADYLSEKTGTKIKLKVLTRYGNIIDNFVSTGLDGAFFGSFTYTLAHAKLGVESIARPVSIDGISSYHGLIFARKGGDIKGAEDMKGKIFAFVDKATTAGYLLPLSYFRKHGIGNYRTYFKETYFAGTHEDAIYDVLNKKADIGAAKNTIYYKLANIDDRIKSELFVLEKSPDVPENGLAVRKDLDVSVKSKLKETLLNMHNDPAGKTVLEKFGAQRFIETKDNDYHGVYDYVKTINLNLATYDYIND